MKLIRRFNRCILFLIPAVAIVAHQVKGHTHFELSKFVFSILFLTLFILFYEVTVDMIIDKYDLSDVISKEFVEPDDFEKEKGL